MELRGVTLEQAPAVRIEVKDGETLGAAISSAREEIATLRQQLQAVRSAPLPSADQKRLAAEYVQRLQRSGKRRKRER